MKDNAFEAAIKGIVQTVSAEDLVEMQSKKTNKTYYTTKSKQALFFYIPVPGQPGKVGKAQVNVSVNFTDIIDASQKADELAAELAGLEARRAALLAAGAKK